MKYCKKIRTKGLAVFMILIACLGSRIIYSFVNDIESQTKPVKEEASSRGYTSRISIENNNFFILGWKFIEGIDATNSVISIVFEGVYHEESYKVSAIQTERIDVTNRFGEGKLDYDNSGYSLVDYDVSNFTPDLYKVGILIENGEDVVYEELDFSFQIESELGITLEDILIEQGERNYKIEQDYKQGEYSEEIPFKIVDPYNRMKEATLLMYDTIDEETGKLVRVFEYENTKPLVFGNDEVGYHTIKDKLMNGNFVLTSDIFIGDPLYNDSFFVIDPVGRIVAEYIVEDVKQVSELANGNFLALGRKLNGATDEQAFYEIDRNNGTNLRAWDPAQKAMDEIIALYEDEENPKESYEIMNLDWKAPRYGELPEVNLDNTAKLPQYDKSLKLVRSEFIDNGIHLIVEIEADAEEEVSDEIFLYFVGEETYKHRLGTGNEIVTYIDNWIFSEDWYEIYLVRGNQMTEVLAEWANQPIPTREMKERRVDVQVDNPEYGTYIEESFYYDDMEATLVATAKDGYEVKAWLEEGKWISQGELCEFEVDGDTQLELIIRKEGSFYYPFKNMIENFAFIVTAILLILGSSIYWYKKGEYNIER